MRTVPPRRRSARLLVLLVAALAVALAAPPGAQGAPQQPPARGAAVDPDVVPGALLVTSLTAEDANRLQRVIDLDTTPALESASSRALSDVVTRVRVPVGDTAAAVAALRSLPGVVAVEPVRTRRFSAVPNDPDYPKQWAHALTQIERAWDRTTGSRSVRVAVIDSGMFGSHRDLTENIVEQADVSTGRVRPRAVGTDNDLCGVGHGTLVAGVLGARGNNGLDVAGAAWEVSLLDLALTSPDSTDCDEPRPADDAIIAAIDYATTHPSGPVDVINLSLGGPQDACPRAYQSVIDAARAAGIVVVAAAGNEELTPWLAGAPQVPASCAGVVSVGAAGMDGTRAGYSTTNEHVDLIAPGGDSDRDGFAGQILSTARTNGVQPTEGTSFAAPYVAGVAALLLSLRPTLTAEDVESVLERTAGDRGPAGRDDEYGWGLVDAANALALVDSGTDVPPPAPDPDFPVGDTDGGGVTPPPTEPVVFRIEPPTAGTTPVVQAVAVSQAVFAAEQSAEHVVLARRDDYADALAGSALGFGVGPLLFTSSTGSLHPETRDELERVLARGRTVYLLGGPAALPATLEEELRALGYRPVRLAGRTREETAVLVADEVARLLPGLGYESLPYAILATRQNWPDAVAAGALAAYFGVPIFLTPPDALHPVTADALAALAPTVLYVVGGRAAITPETEAAAAAVTNARVERLAGAERTATTVAVGREIVELIGALYDSPPGFAIAVNVRGADAFAHVLSASAIAGAFSGVYIPVEGDGGTILTEPARAFAAELHIDGVVVGGSDVVSTDVEEELAALLRG